MTDSLYQMTETEKVVDPSHELISSARVEGTPVVNMLGEKLGSIHSLMIHKKTGQVAYALLSFGGFLRIGAHVHPIPWEKLTYDAQLHRYRISLTRTEIEQAPLLHLDNADRPTDCSFEERTYDYAGAARYWGL